MKKQKYLLCWLLLAALALIHVNKAAAIATSTQRQFSRPSPIARVPLFPVRGNHESKSDLFYIVNSMLPAYAGKIQRFDDGGVNYFFDWKNIRIIILDQFSENFHDHDRGIFSWFANEKGDINSSGKEWAENVIKSSGKNIDHIFIAFHEPAFPRTRHVHQSFDKFPQNRNAFWNMLTRHKNKVRAVLVGHTHYYSRMRVKNPLSVTDGTVPNQNDGIFQIDCGTTGADGYENTIIEVNIRGKSILFRALQAKSGTASFHVIDQWQINGDTIPISSTPGWSFAFIGDNRAGFSSFKINLEEIRDMKTNPDPVFNPVEFVLIGGDMDPVQYNYESIYLKVFDNIWPYR